MRRVGLQVGCVDRQILHREVAQRLDRAAGEIAGARERRASPPASAPRRHRGNGRAAARRARRRARESRRRRARCASAAACSAAPRRSAPRRRFRRSPPLARRPAAARFRRLRGHRMERLRVAQRHRRRSLRRFVVGVIALRRPRLRRERDLLRDAVEHRLAMAAAHLSLAHRELLRRHAKDGVAAGTAGIFFFGHHGCRSTRVFGRRSGERISGVTVPAACLPARPSRPRPTSRRR